MSILAIIGLNGYTKTSTRKEFTQEASETTIETYEGPIAKVDELYAESTASVLSGEIDKVTDVSSNGKGVLELHYSGGSGSTSADPTDTFANTIWELVPQDIYKNIRSYNGDVAGSFAFNKDADQEGLEAVRLFFETAGKDGTFPVNGTQVAYYNLLTRGTDQYVRTIAVLRSRLTVSKSSLLTADWTGVDRAWRLTGDSASGGPDLNVGQATIIGQIESMPEADNNLKQWLKRGPGITMNGNQSFTMTQEWWFAKAWSHNQYDGDDVDGNP